jgi:hypothetical protein
MVSRVMVSRVMVSRVMVSRVMVSREMVGGPRPVPRIAGRLVQIVVRVVSVHHHAYFSSSRT